MSGDFRRKIRAAKFTLRLTFLGPNYCAAQVILSRLQMHQQSETPTLKLNSNWRNRRKKTTSHSRSAIWTNSCARKLLQLATSSPLWQRPCFEKVETMQIAVVPPTLLRRWQHPPAPPTCRPELKRAGPHLCRRSELTLASNLSFFKLALYTDLKLV